MPLDKNQVPDTETGEHPMTITIPPAALEAAARAVCAGDQWGNPCFKPCVDCLQEARAAALALLENWPGMREAKNGSSISLKPHIILPLTETDNDKA